MVQGVPRRDRPPQRQALCNPPGLRGGVRRARTGAGALRGGLRPGRPLPQPQLRSCHPVDELWSAGLPHAPHHLHGHTPRVPGGPPLGIGRMDPLPGRGATAPLALAPHLAASALGRRTFVKGLALLPGVFLPRAAAAEVTFRLGLVFPNEPQRESGRLMALGAQLGLDEANALAGFFGKRLELVQEVADTPEAVLAAGLRLVRQERVVALVGGADDASAEALRDAAQRGDVLFFNVGATSNRLRGARCHRHAFHMEASLAMYVDGVGEWLLDQRKLARWMLVTGNSSLGREVEQ